MLYSGIISHFKEVDVLCFSGCTNTLCKSITKGLSVKFKEVFQVVNTRLTQCLQWKTLGGKKRMLNQNELWNGHIYRNLKKRKKKSTIVSSKIAQVIVPLIYLSGKWMTAKMGKTTKH